MKKQTAVEWFASTLSKAGLITQDDFDSLVKQAKEMEKQQIVDAFIGYDSDTKDNLEVAEQYYNETFKNDEK
jgi:hypothetical protein